MRNRLRYVLNRLRTWGFDPLKTSQAVRFSLRARIERHRFHSEFKRTSQRELFAWARPRYMYHDFASQAGTARGHYFHQDLWVAQRVFEAQPRRHVDVGSSITGFVSHVASFRQIEVIDIRPLNSEIENVTFIQKDMMDDCDLHELISDSVSCLHALEHFGLGRYGDQIDPEGWESGFRSLTTLVSKGGTLYLGVPTSYRQRIEFNEQRVFSIPFLRELFRSDFEIHACSFIHDDGSFSQAFEPWSPDADASFGAEYGCSVWALIKK